MTLKTIPEGILHLNGIRGQKANKTSKYFINIVH